MKKVHLYILLLVSIGWNIYVGFNEHNSKKQRSETNSAVKSILSNNEKTIDDFKKLLARSYTSKFSFKKLKEKKFFNKNKVVLYISEENCSKCIYESLNYLEILSEKIGKDRIVLIGNYTVKEDFDALVKYASNYISTNIYYKNILNKDFNKDPAIFLMNENLEVNSLFIPNLYEDYKETYFSEILPAYFKK